MVVFDQHPRENAVLSERALRHSDAVQTSLSGGHTSLLTGFGPRGLLSTVSCGMRWCVGNGLLRTSQRESAVLPESIHLGLLQTSEHFPEF